MASLYWESLLVLCMNHIYQAWEWIVMKKTENSLQWGYPQKILKQKNPFGAFWCILISCKNGSRRPKKRKSVKKLKTLMPDIWDQIINRKDWDEEVLNCEVWFWKQKNSPNFVVIGSHFMLRVKNYFEHKTHNSSNVFLQITNVSQIYWTSKLHI